MATKKRARAEEIAPLAVEEPPIAEGTDAVARWAQDAGLALGQDGGGERSRLVRRALDLLGQARGAAADAEALLELLRRHGEDVEDARGASPPGDEVALTLWQWFELARLAWALACGPYEIAGALAEQARNLAANIRARPTARVEEIRRRLRLGRDARTAVAAHDEVSAKLASEALDDEAAQAARESLVDFGKWMRRSFQAPAHIQILVGALEAVERGEIKRLIVELPPRHGKSTVVSELFPAWYMGRHPDRDILCASSSQEKADDFGRAVRNGIASAEFGRAFPGVHLAGDSSAAARFSVETDEAWQGDGGQRGGSRLRRGVYKSYGRTGRYTGSGAHILILDDLIAEHEADSEAAKREAHRAIQALRSRLAPSSEGAAWVIVNTRYREDDPIGYILSEYASDGPWTVVRLPAIAEEDEAHALPDGSTWRRKAGDPLWPERYTLDDLHRLRDSLLRVSPQDWYGQYLCRPVPASGAMIDVGWFKRYGVGGDGRPAVEPRNGERAPTKAQVLEWATRIVVSVDTSKGTGANAARTAIEVWAELVGRGLLDGVYLVDAQADPIGFEVQLDRVKAVCNQYRPHAVLIEDKSTGEVLIPMLRNASGWAKTPVIGITPPPGADKVARLSTCTPQIRDGQVWIPARGAAWASWLADFEKEMTFFPKGKFKDLVDAASQFLNWRRENPVLGTISLGEGVDSAQLQRALGGSWHANAPSGGGRRGLYGGAGMGRRGW